MATLVTGGAGFVGSNIVKGLAERGHQVVCFDLTPADALLRKFLEPWSDQVTFAQGNILDEMLQNVNAVRAFLKRPLCLM